MPRTELDDRYITWLYSQVGSVKVRQKNRTHWSLFHQLHETAFVALVARDDNRIGDAKDLRYEFLAETDDEQGDPDWTRSPCSMLELLVVLARQLAFEMDDDVDLWFWHLIETLELEKYNDREYNEDSQESITRAMDRVIWRQYEPDGTGGLFPLHNPHRDQREIELWYQLNAYLLEQF